VWQGAGVGGGTGNGRRRRWRGRRCFRAGGYESRCCPRLRQGEGNRWRDKCDDDNDDVQTSVSGGDDGDCALSLTQEAEDPRAEPRVAPREFGRPRKGGGPPEASLRRGKNKGDSDSNGSGGNGNGGGVGNSNGGDTDNNQVERQKRRRLCSWAMASRQLRAGNGW
jgi:hypothetical protein